MDPVVSVYTAADFENQIRGVKFHSRYFFGGNWVLFMFWNDRPTVCTVVMLLLLLLLLVN